MRSTALRNRAALFGMLLFVCASGDALAQSNAGKKTLPRKPKAQTQRSTRAPASEDSLSPLQNDDGSEELRAAQEEADRAAAAEAAAAAAAASEPMSAPRKVAPAKAKPAPAPAKPAALASDELPEPQTPALAPFTSPTDSRPLPPPAPTPDGDSDLEQRLTQFQADPLVSSLKRKQKLSEVPMTVSWIPAEELEGTGQFTLCDAIQYFPGMECRHGAMRKAVVSARGLGSNFLSNRLLLLRDGRPETDPWTGIFYPDETTPLTNIKQIEVIRGPGSSLYGSNAFSGVINIIQRNPDDLIKPGNNVGADLRLLGGQFNTARLQTTVAGKAGPVGALLNYYGYRSDGAQLLSDPKLNIIDKQEWSTVHQVSGKIVAGPFKLDASYTNARLGRPGGQKINAVGNCGRCHYTENDSEFVENVNVNATVDQKVNDVLRVFAEGYAFFKRREVELENQITNAMQPTLGKRRRIGGEARALLSLGDLSLTLGGDVKFDAVNNQNIRIGLTDDQTRQTIVGAFVDAEYRITSNLILGAGLRYDLTMIPIEVWSTPSSQFSPRASLVYHATPQLSFRANYGRAFRAPTLAELAINQQMYASTLVGNSALAPEILDTVEGAVDVWPSQGRVRLTGKGIYTVAQNFINQEFLFGSTSQFRNIGNAVVIGAEAEAAAQIPAINSSFDIAYQFLSARARNYDGSNAGQLDYAPSHRVHFRGRTTVGRFFADLYALFVSTRQDPALAIDPTTGASTTDHIQLPSYLVASARVGFNVVDNLSVSVFASNLFNTQYEESYGFPRPGLSVFSEVKFIY